MDVQHQHALATGLETLIKAAELQKLRQLKKLVQLKRKAEQQLQLQREWEVKHETQAAREQLRALEAQRRHDDMATTTTLRDTRRHSARAAADARADELRAAAEAKLSAAEERSLLIKAQRNLKRELDAQRRAEGERRRQQIKAQSALRQQEQQSQYVAKMVDVERTLRRKEVEQELERRQRSMLEAEKDARRREAAKRAEAEQTAKEAYYERKLAEKEDLILSRRLQHEQELEEKSRQRQMRDQLVHSHVQQAKSMNELERQDLANKLSEKMMRTDIMEEQRQHLIEQMALIRREMAVQEAKLKDAFEKMVRTGRLDLPPELNELQRSGMLDLYPTARPSSAPPVSASTTYPSVRPASSKLYRSTFNQGPKHDAGGWATVDDDDAGSGMIPAHVEATGREHLDDEPLSATQRELKAKAVLEEEHAREAERQMLMGQVANPVERQRLLQVYAHERELAKRRILSLGASAF